MVRAVVLVVSLSDRKLKLQFFEEIFVYYKYTQSCCCRRLCGSNYFAQRFNTSGKCDRIQTFLQIQRDIIEFAWYQTQVQLKFSKELLLSAKAGKIGAEEGKETVPFVKGAKEEEPRDRRSNKSSTCRCRSSPFFASFLSISLPIHSPLNSRTVAIVVVLLFMTVWRRQSLIY